MGESLMQLFDFINNSTVVFFMANTLYVISYMVTSMFWLRALAIIAAASTVPYFYFQPEPLWTAIFWQGCYLVVNLINLLIMFYSMRATNFDEDEDLAYEVKFSELKPHEVRPIFKFADRMSFAEEKLLLKEGEDNHKLFLVLEGECRVVKNGKEVAVLRAGQFVGELSFLSSDAVSADVFAEEGTKLMCWDRHRLAPLFKRQGLYESYFYSLCSLDVASKLRTMTAGNAAAS